MSRRYNINNIDELHAMVNTLKYEHRAKGQLLAENSKAYLNQFTLGSLVKKYATPSAFLKIDNKLNVSSGIMSMVLPFLMNSTLFKRSGFLTKSLVGFLSNKLGKGLDAEHISAIFNSIKSLLGGAKKTKKEQIPEEVDYGIPPDSETY